MSSQDHIQDLYETARAPQKACNILVADDDPSIVNLLSEDLIFLGHRVIQAHDGQMAIRLARLYNPELIVLDVNMPMTNGLKALQYLRSSPETARIPIIFITGEMSKDIFPALEETPRVALIKKPFDLDGFNTLVQQFLHDYPTQ